MPPPVALSEIVVVVQVRTFVTGVEITAFGNKVFCKMICEAVVEQPFTLVTVTV